MSNFQELSQELLSCVCNKNAMIVKLFKQLAKKDKQLARAAQEITVLQEKLNQERYQRILAGTETPMREAFDLELTSTVIDEYSGQNKENKPTSAGSSEGLSLMKELEQAQIEDDELFEETILKHLDELKASKIFFENILVAEKNEEKPKQEPAENPIPSGMKEQKKDAVNDAAFEVSTVATEHCENQPKVEDAEDEECDDEENEEEEEEEYSEEDNEGISNEYVDENEKEQEFEECNPEDAENDDEEEDEEEQSEEDNEEDRVQEHCPQQPSAIVIEVQPAQQLQDEIANEPFEEEDSSSEDESSSDEKESQPPTIPKTEDFSLGEESPDSPRSIAADFVIVHPFPEEDILCVMKTGNMNQEEAVQALDRSQGSVSAALLVGI